MVSFPGIDNISQKVVFSARLTSTKSLNTFSIVQFDDIIINEGGHYFPGDGVFVAPVSGVYLFSWTTITFNVNSVYTELRVANVIKAVVGHGASTSLYSTGSTTTTCHVNRGDHVWVQTSEATPLNYIHYWKEDAAFMGVLIYED